MRSSCFSVLVYGAHGQVLLPFLRGWFLAFKASPEASASSFLFSFLLVLYSHAFHFTKKFRAMSHASPQPPAPFRKYPSYVFPSCPGRIMSHSCSKSALPPVQCIFFSSQGTCFIISLLFHVPSLFLSCQYKIYSTILNLANLSLASVIAPVTLCHYPPQLLFLWKLLGRTDYIQQQVWLLAYWFTDTNLARWSDVLSSLILAGNL